jgi:hypothetical protein
MLPKVDQSIIFVQYEVQSIHQLPILKNKIVICSCFPELI